MNLSIENLTINYSGMPSMASALISSLLRSDEPAAPEAEQSVHGRPLIGQEWPGQGGVYIGARLIDGAVHHVVIADGGTKHDIEDQDFKAAQGAQFGDINGHSDWHAGDQEDLMLAYINAREHFVHKGSDSIYWSRSEHHGWPWAVDFENGLTFHNYRTREFRVRPFRSFPDSSL